MPKNYTITLRILPNELHRDTQPPAPSRKRKRSSHSSKPVEQVTPPTSDIDDAGNDEYDRLTDSNRHGISGAKNQVSAREEEAREQAVVEEVHRTNAYPGSRNSINSIHQRRWLLSLDPVASGFVPDPGEPSGGNDVGGKGGRRRWIRKRDEGTGELMGFEPFHVLGREVERSIVTGRLAGDVLRDEGVEGFVARRGWTGITG